MFTPKANSKQKWVKKHKNTKLEVLTACTARGVHTHSSAKKRQSVHTARAMHTHGCAHLTGQLFLLFSVFTISRIKFKPLIRFWCHFCLRAPNSWLYHNLQKNSSFNHPKNYFPKPHTFAHLQKCLNTDFSHENPFSPKQLY